jgi:hypothetical protein
MLYRDITSLKKPKSAAILIASSAAHSSSKKASRTCSAHFALSSITTPLVSLAIIPHPPWSSPTVNAPSTLIITVSGSRGSQLVCYCSAVLRFVGTKHSQVFTYIASYLVHWILHLHGLSFSLALFLWCHLSNHMTMTSILCPSSSLHILPNIHHKKLFTLI